MVTVTVFFLNCVSRIVEKNPKKFKIDATEVAERRQFVERAKAFVKVCRLFLDFNKEIWILRKTTCTLEDSDQS